MPREVLCSECRRRPALQVWLPIPRLGGKRKRVCRECTITLTAQEQIGDEQLLSNARAAAQVDRAVHNRRLAALRPDGFRSPVDAGDVAEDEGHPLARRSA